jgi:hypothetical protein
MPSIGQREFEVLVEYKYLAATSEELTGSADCRPRARALRRMARQETDKNNSKTAIYSDVLI